MRKVLVVLAISAAFGLLTALGAVACGGPDKPPLTPDTDTPTPDGSDAAAPTSSATPPK